MYITIPIVQNLSLNTSLRGKWQSMETLTSKSKVRQGSASTDLLIARAMSTLRHTAWSKLPSGEAHLV